MFRHPVFWLATLACFALVSSAKPGTFKSEHRAKVQSPSPAGLTPPGAMLSKLSGRQTAKASQAPAGVHVASASSSGSLTSLLQARSLSLPVPVPSGSAGLIVSWDERTGVPRRIEVTASPAVVTQAIPDGSDPVAAAKSFLAAHRDLLRIKDPEAEFAVAGKVRDERGVTHVRFQQMFAGREVWGSELLLHVGPNAGVVLSNGDYHRTPNLSVAAPEVASGAAVATVARDLQSRGVANTMVPAIQRLLDYDGPVTKEVIWHDPGDVPHHAWFVELRTSLEGDWYYFVDAKTGAILDSYNNTKDDGPTTASGTDLNGATQALGTYAAGSEYYMVDASQPMFNAGSSQIPQNPVGAIVALDLRGRDMSAQDTMYYVMSSNNQWGDPSSVSAQYNAGRTYNFYRQVFGRNSIDDKGMTIYSILHVTSHGEPMDNAFWSGGVMCYGDGNTAFKPLAGGFDVAAHEMTHGVTEHTANLVYQGQSGALNESMSDVFAAVVDSANWTIAEQVIKDLTAYPSGALRDLSNPHNGGSQGDPGWQPATMAEFVSTTGDNGGVHVNSGIPNNAFYRVATSIGRSKSRAIWYKALTSYLTSSAQFVDARIATEAAAKELYGDPGPEITAVRNAWDGVQVFEGAGTPPPPSSSLSGDSWILAVNTSPSDPNSLYKIKPVIQSSADFFPLSATPVLTRPAVSDASGLVIFVDTDNNVRVLSASASNPGETKLDSSGVWWSVAVGPGLTSIALTSKYVDTTIYYYDAVNNQSKQFKIRTAAYDGAAVGTALYADALSFDPSGRYLLFDSFNKTKTAQGDTLSFWTIDLLDVTTGDMRSVFPPQPEGIDIGNPSFSKTAGYRFTFDYWDPKAGNGYVLAADIFRGAVGQVAGPLPVPGYPTYSGDDGTIAFHTLISGTGTPRDDIQQEALDTSRIAGSGTPSDYLSDATFPVWFVVGSRVTGVEDDPHTLPVTTALLQNYPNPFNPSTAISYKLSAGGVVSLRVFDVLGRQVASLVNEVQQAGEHTVTFKASGLASGVYFYRLEAGGSALTKKLILLR